MSLPTEADVGLLSPVWVGTLAEALTGDREVLEAMVAFEAALGRALVKHGLAATGGVVDAAGINVRGLARDAVSPGNPTVPLVAALRASVPAGEDSSGLHHGATSQDVVDTALMLVSSAVLREVETHLVLIARRLAVLVEEHRSVPCVARTLTQQAMPTTLGFRVAGWLAGVLDALAVVRACQPLPVSLGGPVGTLAAYGASGPNVVASVASDLGLTAPVVSWHTRRTPVLGVASALAAVGEACGRICADLLLMSQTEVGEASDGSGGGSSAMTHKANPTRSVLVVAAVRQLPGLLATVASSGAEASERPAGAWHAEWQPLRTMLRLAGAAVERTADIAGDVTFDAGAMSRNLGLLLTAVGKDQVWATAQTEHVGVWIDRVLDRHKEVC